MTNVATCSAEDNILTVSVVHHFFPGGHTPLQSDRVVSVSAIASEAAFVEQVIVVEQHGEKHKVAKYIVNPS